MGNQETPSHPLKVEEIFLESLSGLSLLALVNYIRVFFVAAAFVVFTAVSLPVTKTHPAKVCYKIHNTLLEIVIYFPSITCITELRKVYMQKTGNSLQNSLKELIQS